MPVVHTSEIVDSARRDRGGVVAFNVITLEHAEAVVTGAEAAGLPVIVQISENVVRYHMGQVAPLMRASAAVAESAGVPVALHLDHVEDKALFHAAASMGFSSVMFDASTLAFEENVESTRAAADWAHRHGMWLEAELGEIGGKNGVHAPGARTDPVGAADFVARTGVDGLAVAVGSSHAMTTRVATLDLGLIADLRAALPIPLVLHGSSGVSDSDLVAAVAAGITKVNVGTILNVAFTGAIRAYLAADETVVDPRKYLAPARCDVARVVTGMLMNVAVPTPPM